MDSSSSSAFFPLKDVHLLRIDWDDGDIPQASFLCREWGDQSATVERIPISTPFELSCAFSKENYCIGQFNGENEGNQRISLCGKLLKDGFEQCSECRSSDSSQMCVICRGDCEMLDPHCFVPHIVYLAAYTSKDIKVGVSTKERFRKRIVEQGALLAVTIANASNGKVARLLESKVQSGCHVPDKVKLKTRLDSFIPNQSLDSLKDAILKARKKVFSSIAPPEGISYVDKGEFFDLLTNYNSSVARFGDFYPQQLSLDDTCGLVVYVKGPDFLLRIGNSFYVLPFKQAIGKVLTPIGTNNGDKVRRQATFSDYFLHQEEA
jgi:hypothetical protein